MRTVGVFVRNKCLTLYTHQSLFLTIILPQDQLEQITGVELQVIERETLENTGF